MLKIIPNHTKIALSIFSLFAFVFISCKNEIASKIKSEKVIIAAEKDDNSTKLPSIIFDKTEHDFGVIPDGTPVETKFKYTNVGNSMLVVSNIKSTCGCTVPSDYQKEVPPGETAEFTVKFNGRGSGKVTKSLTMTTNTANGSETVKITANVKKDPNAQTTKPAKTTLSPIQVQSAK